MTTDLDAAVVRLSEREKRMPHDPAGTLNGDVRLLLADWERLRAERPGLYSAQAMNECVQQRDAARAEVERLVHENECVSANAIAATEAHNKLRDELARLRERDARVRMELGMAIGRCHCTHESSQASTLHHAEKALALLKETP